MNLPLPKRGTVIRYSYLWHNESKTGLEEGRKDRPCAVVLVSNDDRVVVCPITHTRPTGNVSAVELPAAISKQTGLDDAPSWVITSEVNHFQWPGYDIRPAKHGTMEFGLLPSGIMKKIIAELMESRERQRLKQTARDS